MAGTDQLDSRITTWPGFPVPVPKVQVWPVEMRGEELAFSSIGVESEEVEVPEEFYLRELPALNLADASAILDFTRVFGHLGDAELADLPYVLQPEHPDGEYARILFPDKSSLPVRGASGREEPEEVPFVWSMKLGVFRLHAWTLRDVSRITSWLQKLMTFEQVTAAWETPGPVPQLSGDLIDFLVNIVNAGLAYCRVEVRADLLDEKGKKPLITWGREGPNLYQVLCLQVCNHLNEEATLRQCANETCSQFFYKQRGRAKKGQHRASGVMYCSSYCAGAQAQRQVRRHRQSALNLHRRGLDISQIAAQLGVAEERATVWLGAALKRVRR